MTDYLDCLVSQLEGLRIAGADSEGEFDDRVIESIDGFLPYRNEAIELVESLAKYRDTEETPRLLHRFFEGLIPYMECPEGVSHYQKWDYDNYKFIVRELFLYCIAILIRHRRFKSAANLMVSEYYMPERPKYGQPAMVPFTIFRNYMQSFEYRKNRLKTRRLSLRADLLSDRCKGHGIPFRDLMQAGYCVIYARPRRETQHRFPLVA